MSATSPYRAFRLYRRRSRAVRPRPPHGHRSFQAPASFLRHRKALRAHHPQSRQRYSRDNGKASRNAGNGGERRLYGSAVFFSPRVRRRALR